MTALTEELGPPFKRGRGGPGGWIILTEPELHLGGDILVPDLAGWRRETMSVVANEPYFTIRPDWICEVLSPSTERYDRAAKVALYAAAGVSHAWLVNPLLQSLEVLGLSSTTPGQWSVRGVQPRRRDGAGHALRGIRAGPLDPLARRPALTQPLALPSIRASLRARPSPGGAAAAPASR
jgi:hypothetical protein